MSGARTDKAGAALADVTLRAAGSAAARAAARVADRAAEAGLVDVAYTRADSPLGPLVVAATDRGLVRVAYASYEREDDVVEELSRRISPRTLESPARLDPIRRELDEYFSGRRHRFEQALDWRLVRGFNRCVLDVTARIPYGETASYAQVAQRAGSVRAHRAAGNALNRNPLPIVVPCHRVLRTGGDLGGYGGGLEAKAFLLRLEGGVAPVVGERPNAERPGGPGVLGRGDGHR
jgi:methylated-DNA-[protein]-cysteine S-methyltransferase